jgi:hypothetical protein
MSDPSFRFHSEDETGAKRIRNTVKDPYYRIPPGKIDISLKVHSVTESLGTTMNLCTLRSACNSNLMFIFHKAKSLSFNSLAGHVAYSRKPISSEVQPMLLL